MIGLMDNKNVEVSRDNDATDEPMLLEVQITAFIRILFISFISFFFAFGLDFIGMKYFETILEMPTIVTNEMCCAKIEREIQTKHIRSQWQPIQLNE